MQKNVVPTETQRGAEVHCNFQEFYDVLPPRPRPSYRAPTPVGWATASLSPALDWPHLPQDMRSCVATAATVGEKTAVARSGRPDIYM